MNEARYCSTNVYYEVCEQPIHLLIYSFIYYHFFAMCMCMYVCVCICMCM